MPVSESDARRDSVRLAHGRYSSYQLRPHALSQKRYSPPRMDIVFMNS